MILFGECLRIVLGNLENNHVDSFLHIFMLVKRDNFSVNYVVLIANIICN